MSITETRAAPNPDSFWETNNPPQPMSGKPEKGYRKNEGKPQLSYLLESPKAMEGLVRALEFGESKGYARGAWREGKLSDLDIIDSMMRHLQKYMSGEYLDEESGLPHKDLIFSNAMFLAERGRTE